MDKTLLTIPMYSWSQYNERLVRRGEIIISDGVIQSWDKELAVMKRDKEGRKFLFPESFMKIVGYARAYFGPPYRQTEGLLRTYGTTIPKVPDYTAIHKRVNKLDIRMDPKVGSDIVIAIDSTGIKVRKNSSFKSSGCYPRKMAVMAQLTDYKYWKDSVRYGKRWIVESVFSVLKRIFGEHVMAHKR